MIGQPERRALGLAIPFGRRIVVRLLEVVDVSEALLRFPGFSLLLRATDGSVMASAGPYENWAACEVAVDVPGFSGRFQRQVMPPEVLRFASDLEALHDRLSKGGEVTFRP